MNTHPSLPPRSMGITLRTALLSWLVTITTLIVFVVFIVPQQKRTFVESLESKAHSVAVSLRDVAAGAAINEDYSSVVDHSKEMITGDSSLVYIIITRNDGFSLIHDREGWRAETDVGKEWRPDERVPRGSIGRVPLFDQSVYHYSQPFDYSAIQWGWIHVGLSLDTYNDNVSSLYRATGLVSLGCILFSMFASVIYAKRLVHPILTLRETVQSVAQGDLNARAPIHRSDEIGALSSSVNLMTEALQRRDRILSSVRHAAERFLSADDWRQVIPDVLRDLGQASDVNRVSLFQSIDSTPDAPVSRLVHFWQSPRTATTISYDPPEYYRPHDLGFGDWLTDLSAGKMLVANTAELEDVKRQTLEQMGIKTIMILPIRVGGRVWGSVNFDACEKARDWPTAEQNSLRAAIDMLGATIDRQGAQQALLEANDSLERRVAERTRELVDEVEAKELARAELAAAQQQLINTSRQAGMAEIATGVLHNVGNVLNSVNVSSALLSERLSESKLRSLRRLVDLVQEHRHDFKTFVANDPRGSQIPDFLAQLTDRLEEESRFLIDEHEQLSRNVAHIKEIVSLQQSYARVSGFLQQIDISEVINDAVQINATAFERHGVAIVRDYPAGPTAVIDKHKFLQIFVNLLQNAKHALTEANQSDRKVTITIAQPDATHVRISVSDNGIGIPPENLTRVFSHGFTTRQHGHGFGLHSGANFAKEMGGSLVATSEGLNRGATFTLELPLQQPMRRN